MGNYAEWERCYSLAEEIKMKMPIKIIESDLQKYPDAPLYTYVYWRSLRHFRNLGGCVKWEIY